MFISGCIFGVVFSSIIDPLIWILTPYADLLAIRLSPGIINSFTTKLRYDTAHIIAGPRFMVLQPIRHVMRALRLCEDATHFITIIIGLLEIWLIYDILQALFYLSFHTPGLSTQVKSDLQQI